jgi:hypothetical protein
MTVAIGWDPTSGPTSVLGALGESLTTVTPAGATFPIGGIASPAFSMGENPVHSWTNDGGAYVVTFLKASLWNLTRPRCLEAGCEAMVRSRSCSRDMLELGNDNLLWPPASGNPVSHLSWVVVYSVVYAWGASPSWWFTLRLVVYKFALYLSMKAGKTDLLEKKN